MDSRIGVYPKISRIGDKDRRGNNAVTPFDDTETVIFQEGVGNLLIGSLVRSGSTQSLFPYAGNNNPNGGITSKGNKISGISDSFYMTDYKELSSRKNDNENISAFDESRVHLQDTIFYMTGTSETVYSGFSSRLYDKTQVVIDISSTEKVSVGNVNRASTSGLGEYDNDDADVRQPLMAYYNFALKRWEHLGKGIGKNQTNRNETTFQDIVTKGHVGFSGLPNKNSIATGSASDATDFSLFNSDYLSSANRPISTFGFPFDGRYHGTGSQVINMADYIDRPFLLEKLSLTFNAEIESIDSVGSSPFNRHGRTGYQLKRSYRSTSGDGFPSAQAGLDAYAVCHNFFLLRQFKSNRSTTYTVTTGSKPILGSQGYGVNTYTTTLPGDYYLSPNEILTRVEDERELITYGQFLDVFANEDIHLNSITDDGSGLTRSGVLSSKIIEGRDSVFIRSDRPMSSGITGSFSVNFSARHTGGILESSGLHIYTGSGQTSLLWLNNEFSSRGSNRLDKTSRALVNGHPSLTRGRQVLINALRAADEPFVITPSAESSLDDISPYILFPEDKIILGYQYPIPFEFGGSTGAGSVQDDNGRNIITFDGPAKLTLFGSQVKNNQEFHDTLNQPLTSEAIHEGLHYDNPVIDQFNVNYRSEYSGSYLDNYRPIESNLSTESDITVSSIIGGLENQYPASMQRFARLSNNKEVFFDTLLPDPTRLWQQQTGASPVLSSSGETLLSFGSLNNNAQNPEIANLLASSSNSKWFKSNVYNNNLGRVVLESQRKNLANTILFFNENSGSVIANNNGKDQFIKTFKSFNFNGNESVSGVPTITSKNQIQNYLMWLYGVGTGPFGSLSGINPDGDENYVVTQRPRGYKYGVMSTTEMFRSNVFRYDKFGNFADMLEQSFDTATFDKFGNALKEQPVKINFVVQENDNTFKILDSKSVLANTFNSSNIDIHASSSLPFTDDGVAVNRGVASTSTEVETSSRSTVTVVRDAIDEI
jgi:hypothetical protein